MMNLFIASLHALLISSNRRRYPLFLLMIQLLLVSVLSGCNDQYESLSTVPSKDISSDSNTLIVWGIGDRTEQISCLNSMQSEYILVYNNMKKSPDITEEDMFAALEQAILSGSGPDLVFADPISVNPLFLKEYLLDLYDFMDQDDTISRKDFLPNLLSLMEYNGSLYTTVSSFSISTMAAKSDMIGSMQSWTLSDLSEITQAYGGAAASYVYKENGINFMYQILSCWGNDYGRDMQGNLDRASLLHLLEYCSELPDEGNGEPTGSGFFAKADLAGYLSLCDLESLLGGEVSLIGAPGEAESSSSFSPTTSDSLGITKCCTNPDAAWRVIRLIFSQEYQYRYYVNRAVQMFPTNLSALTQMRQEAMNGVWRDSSLTSYHALSESEISQIDELITECHRLSSIYTFSDNLETSEKIWTVLGEYFEHRASLEVTIGKIMELQG